MPAVRRESTEADSAPPSCPIPSPASSCAEPVRYSVRPAGRGTGARTESTGAGVPSSVVRPPPVGVLSRPPGARATTVRGARGSRPALFVVATLLSDRIQEVAGSFAVQDLFTLDIPGTLSLLKERALQLERLPPAVRHGEGDNEDSVSEKGGDDRRGQWDLSAFGIVRTGSSRWGIVGG